MADNENIDKAVSKKVNLDLLDGDAEDLVQKVLKSSTVVTSGGMGSCINSEEDLDRDLRVIKEVYKQRPFHIFNYELLWAPEDKTEEIKDEEGKVYGYFY